MMVYKGSSEALRVHVNDDVRAGNVPSRFIVTKKTSGDVVIGRKYVKEDEGYCSTMVDELMLWNRSLTGRRWKMFSRYINKGVKIFRRFARHDFFILAQN